MRERVEQSAQERLLMLVDRFDKSCPPRCADFPLRPVIDNGDDWSGTLSKGDALKLRRYLESPRNFLVLVGPTGTGKSTLACAIARHLLLQSGRAAMFISATQMLAQFSYGRENGKVTGADVLETLAHTPILIIDDLGSANEGMTAHQQRSLWALIDARWGDPSKVTIMTSNMAINGNLAGIGLSELLGESSWDRVRHEASVIQFSGESLRSDRSR